MTRISFLTPAALLLLTGLLMTGCGTKAADVTTAPVPAATQETAGKQNAANMQKQFQKMHGGTH